MELIITASIFMIGIVAILTAFMPKDIWANLPLAGILGGVVVWGLAAALLFGLSQELLPSIITMVAPAILISAIMCSVDVSDSFMKGIFVGLISPFLLGIFGILVFEGLFGDGGIGELIQAIAILAFSALISSFSLWLSVQWLKIGQEMKYDFTASQAGLSMAGVAFIGTSIGIFLASIF